MVRKTATKDTPLDLSIPDFQLARTALADLDKLLERSNKKGKLSRQDFKELHGKQTGFFKSLLDSILQAFNGKLDELFKRQTPIKINGTLYNLHPLFKEERTISDLATPINIKDFSKDEDDTEEIDEDRVRSCAKSLPCNIIIPREMHLVRQGGLDTMPSRIKLAAENNTITSIHVIDDACGTISKGNGKEYTVQPLRASYWLRGDSISIHTPKKTFTLEADGQFQKN